MAPSDISGGDQEPNVWQEQEGMLWRQDCLQVEVQIQRGDCLISAHLPKGHQWGDKLKDRS